MSDVELFLRICCWLAAIFFSLFTWGTLLIASGNYATSDYGDLKKPAGCMSLVGLVLVVLFVVLALP